MLLTDYRSFEAVPPPAGDSATPPLTVRRLGLQDYLPIFRCMRYLAEHRDPVRGDEIWLLSHKPVFTQGQAGRSEHLLDPGQIPVVQSDRGGQVTYHGPGQLIAYLLLNVKRRRLSVRQLVELIERSVLTTLAAYDIPAGIRAGAPGVYVNDAKIAALGLRIRRGWSYHGLSLNVNMDLSPFTRINPCGFERLPVTQVADFCAPDSQLLQAVSRRLCNALLEELGYQAHFVPQAGKEVESR